MVDLIWVTMSWIVKSDNLKVIYVSRNEDRHENLCLCNLYNSKFSCILVNIRACLSENLQSSVH